MSFQVITGFYTDLAKALEGDFWHKGVAITGGGMSLGLSTQIPSRAGAFTEPVGGSYNRVATPSPSWVSYTDHNENGVIITFPAPTGSWGKIRTVFSLVNGVCIWQAGLLLPNGSNGILVSSGDPARSFQPGALKIYK